MPSTISPHVASLVWSFPNSGFRVPLCNFLQTNSIRILLYSAYGLSPLDILYLKRWEFAFVLHQRWLMVIRSIAVLFSGYAIWRQRCLPTYTDRVVSGGTRRYSEDPEFQFDLIHLNVLDRPTSSGLRISPRILRSCTCAIKSWPLCCP